jgi:hypothetical protein
MRETIAVSDSVEFPTRRRSVQAQQSSWVCPFRSGLSLILQSELRAVVEGSDLETARFPNGEFG